MKIRSVFLLSMIVLFYDQVKAGDWNHESLLAARRDFWLSKGYPADEALPYYTKIIDGKREQIPAPIFYLGAYANGRGGVVHKWRVNGNLIRFAEGQ